MAWMPDLTLGEAPREGTILKGGKSLPFLLFRIESLKTWEFEMRVTVAHQIYRIHHDFPTKLRGRRVTVWRSDQRSLSPVIWMSLAHRGGFDRKRLTSRMS